MLVRRDDTINTVSHDLRAPLTIILGRAQTILRAPEKQAVVRKSAEAIAVDAQRMNAIIGDLVGSARLESGRLHVSPRPPDLHHLVHRLAEHSAGVLARERIALETPENMPPVMADPTRVERILMNLLTNALKYSPPDTPVTLALAPRDADVVVSVTDRGRGIAPDELPRLFQRYFRGQAGRESGESLGLGLYITRG